MTKNIFLKWNIKIVGAWGKSKHTLNEPSFEKVKGVWKYYHENGKLALEGNFLF
ncbi:hypothetical protein [uncultured Lutibacter sp.]|uniref:hypothetical protein n=1 Tax=uncultured Lutibacter sp. TaxID=437739 RepID=UPI00261BEA24|nr:hypothetical protein [uncultured Lutibacter sp.]